MVFTEVVMKLLRRKIIIREYDFNKVRTKATAKVDRYETLYDRATFTPITKDDLEKEYLIFLLTKDEGVGKTKNPMDHWKPTEFPNSYLWHISKKLYNEDYARWESRFDENGYLVVRHSKGKPETKLGWGVFEKEL
jgi:hypothetical protein